MHQVRATQRVLCDRSEMMSTEKSTFHFAKLNNVNYSSWAFNMKMVLMKENCWEAIEPDPATTSSPSTSANADAALIAAAAKDKKAWYFIGLGVDESQHVHIKNTKGGKEAWNKLRDFHVQTTLSARVRILKQLMMIRIEEGISMQQHLQSVFEKFNQMNEIGHGLENDLAVSIILASLSSEYEPLITALEAWDKERLTIEAVRAKLIEEYQRKVQVKQEEDQSETALKSVKKNDWFCTGCNKKGHTLKFCRSKPKDHANVARVAFIAKLEMKIKQSKAAAIARKRICYVCREKGHQRDKCPSKKTVQSEVGMNCWSLPQGNSNENKTPLSAKEARLSKYYAFVSSIHGYQPFIIDSGASNHMCCDEKLFDDLQLGACGKITIANGESIDAKGKGSIKLFVGSEDDVIEMLLLDVLFVPEMNTNLISVEKITRKKFSVIFTGSFCFLRGNFGSKKIGKYSEGVYTLITPKYKCAISNMDVLCIHEWHNVLAHRNLNDVKKLSSLGVKFKSCNCSDVCDACIKGKMSRLPFPKVAEEKTEPFECITSDLCGKLPVESIGRSKYFATFTDVFSGCTEVSFMRTKDETPDKAIQFIEKLKTQFNKKPKVFRSDRGTEYLNERLQGYLRKEGIKFECSVAYSPQQNGVSERKNRTLMEAARTMLISSALPKNLWAEAVYHANWTFNRIPKSETLKTPYELLTGQIPNFDFHKFGSDVYVMIPYQKRKKLDAKSESMKFLGHDHNSKGFRVLSQTGQISISRDVKFVSSKEKLNDVLSPDNQDNTEAFDPDNLYISENCEKSDSASDSESDYESINGVDDATSSVESNDPTCDQGDEFTSVLNPNSLSVETAATPTALNSPTADIFLTPSIEITTVSGEESISRPRRANRGQTPKHLDDFVLYSANNIDYEPRNYREAVTSVNKSHWEQAMKEELSSIEENRTWTLLDLPPGRKSIGSKWVYKIKHDDQGRVAKYKARLVAQGFTQIYGLDYDEVFAPVARSTTLRLLLSVAGINNFYAKQYDIKTAFLNGNLEEEIFMRQPPGFINSDKVYKLHKSLYGLKQAARVWNQTLNDSLLNINFMQCEVDKCLYVLREQGKICYLLVHVDDIILISNNNQFLQSQATKIGKKFEVKDLGNVKHYLGIDVSKDLHGNFMLSQSQYIDKIIEEAGLCDAKPSKFPVDVGYFKIEDDQFMNNNGEYRKLIGMLLYLATHSRPDISASVSILSQRIEKPRSTDMNEVKRLCRYLKGTKTLKLMLSNALCEQSLHSFSDANWAEDKATRKSNSGYFCSINGGAISWCCRKQDLVTLSSTEAEYVALTETCKETMWLKRLMQFFNISNDSKVVIFTDSQSCLKMIKNDKFSNRTKHIDTKYHFTKNLVSKGEIVLQYVETENNVADMFTKPLGSVKLKFLRERAGLIEVPCNIEGKC